MDKEKQEEYWKNRNERQFLAGEKKGLELAKLLKENYEESLKSIEKEINAFYGKYAKDNEIKWEDAKKLLDKSQLKSFKQDIKEYVRLLKNNNSSKEAIQKSSNLYIKSKISRLEELKVQIQKELSKLAIENQKKLENYLSETYIDEYYKTIFNVDKNIGFATNFSKLDTKTVQKAVAKKYDLGNYSIGLNKVWENTEYIMKILEQKIPQGLTLGYNPRKLAELVSKQLKTSYNSSVRLIRTEYNAIMNEATSDGYKQCGIEQYQILATLDNRTSEICQEMDLKIFDLSRKEVGINYPPFHPNCRTTTIPYFEPDKIDKEFGIGSRIAKDKDGNYIEVPANITYKQWKEKFI